MRCMGSSWLAALLAGCIAPITEAEEAPREPALGVGEARSIVLHTFRLDVERYQLVLDLDDLRALPPEIVDELHVLDIPLDLLVEEVLHRLVALSPQEVAALRQPSANVRELLLLSPDGVDLAGTSFAPLDDLSVQVGIPLARPLADLFQVGVTEPLLPPELLAQAVTDGLVASHPAAPGGSLPVTLGDLLRDFEGLEARLGPAETEWGLHPGIVTAIEEDFAIRMRVQANGLPFAGVDLTDVSPTRLNSIGSQVHDLFDFAAEDWLELEGVSAEPRVARLGLQLGEDAAAHLGGTGRDDPRGSSAWSLPPWALERMMVDSGARTTAELEPVTVAYEAGTGTELFALALDEAGWLEIRTFANAGPPPPPAYLWDVVLEIAQTRLHDGVVEGAGVGAFEFRDLLLGVGPVEIAEATRRTLASDPARLGPLASFVTENGVGATDVYYRPLAGEDWLYFVQPDDLPLTAEGPARPYDYETVGFFADPELTIRVSTRAAGDHERVSVVPGDVLFVADDTGAAYQLEVLGKPSRARLELAVERVR